MPMMRLLALTTSHEDGGAESHLRVVLQAAQEGGYAISVGLPRKVGTSRLWNDLGTAGWDAHDLPIGRQTASKAGAYSAILLDTLAALWVIARVRPDAILLNLPTPEATPGAMLACALTRVPTTAIFHFTRSDLRITPLRRRVYQLIARSSQHWICVSNYNRAILARAFGVPTRRMAVVRNGTAVRPVAAEAGNAIRRELDIAPDATLVLTTSRLGEQKDHRVIIEALPRLVALDSGLTFAWAGDGPLRDELAAAVRDTGLENHVRILGRRGDVPELLAAADLFLMPSRDEGMPFALAEAMYAGVPVLVSDAGALTEIIQNGENGVVFTCSDPSDLVRAMEWAVTHREQLLAMAKCAREQALREFTVDRMIGELMTHIRTQP
jgi:glycosyltransferase involved in cell wall biosynthesis